VREDAQAGGLDSPVVHVFLPQRSAEDLQKALAGHAAATETLQKPVAPTREAQEARQGEQHTQPDSLIQGVLRDARVFQGGGNEIATGGLCAAVQEAMAASTPNSLPGMWTNTPFAGRC